ncbi:MAG: EAL domain-containing protein [Pseudomonadota bacterium]
MDVTASENIPLHDLQRRVILLVGGDDACVKDMLARGGFTQLYSVTDAAAAPHHLVNVDVIVLYASDPSAYQLCRTVHGNEAWRRIPIILLSTCAGDHDDVMHAAYAAGATDILFRPIEAAQLIPRVTSALLLKIERDLNQRRERELQDELATHRVLEARLQYLAAHDELTGLYNRRRLEQLLELAVIGVHHHQHHSALLYLDLDQFKIVNDTEGHRAGDRLLVSVADYLKRRTDDLGALARISSDDFALLVENIAEEKALEIGEMLRAAVDAFYFESGKKSYHIRASIGVAMITPQEDSTAAEILAHADQACYAAKTQGRNRVQMFRPSDKAVRSVQSDVYWAPLIRDALEHQKFRLVFQPVLDIAMGKITHYEALIRMVDEDGQLLSPAVFISVAERMGLIQEIDFWVVGSAIDWLHELPRHHAHLAVNINLSAQALQNPSLTALVKDRLRTTGVRPERITFEITETAAIANFTQTRKMVNDLRALGCRFALDDFGAGFNSYSYLKHLPVDYLKIDGTFITHLVHDPVDQTLVKSMIEIAHTLGKKTVAEFVEDAPTLDLLKQYGVDYAQGYYLGKPQLGLVEN